MKRKELIDAINELLDRFEDGDWNNLGLLKYIRKIRRLIRERR
jgi:hypothetical protein